MKLTQEAQQSLEFSQACLLQGLCTPKEFLRAVREIYAYDLKKQSEFLIEKGFTKTGAFRHIYNLDRGEEVL